ncbi:MAG TPA: class I tRNA ligase family protein, partial [Candidatus Limnocylindria bacterium]|nr:class I tRNA ligase family protein [Candidatus Limnocylindria bacterium]
LEAETAHQMVVGHCERCGTVVEPRLSIQWFIHVKPLADRALASVREGRTAIVPPHLEKVYGHWMENIHDWAVGRQLWWGHRIPAWFCPDGHVTVTDAEAGPDACAECGRPASELRQETDIFDTWFSSGLWPWSTLGWPERTADFERFYPTTLMETGYDILFFWVARMMMLGLFCTGVEPFSTVYLHGLVRAEGGVKMSKTKGNVVDPLQMIDQVGADALRFALVAGTSPGHDQRLTGAKIDGGRNFTNKLWNLGRFVLGAQPAAGTAPSGEPTLAEHWIRSRVAAAAQRATQQLDGLDLAGYAATVHDLAWSDYADWFVEMAKIELRREDASPGDRARVWQTLAGTLGNLLRLLHPLMPFVTEEIWAALRAAAPATTGGHELLMSSSWPPPATRNATAEAEMEQVIATIREVRNLRTETGTAAGAWLPLQLAPPSAAEQALAQRAVGYITPLARVRPVRFAAAEERPAFVAATPLGAAWLGSDAAEERAAADRRERQVAELEAGIGRLRGLLANPSFVARAPEAVVDKERARLAELESQLEQLR